MFGGRFKASALVNVLILGALSVGIWLYIQQQIVGEREIDYDLQVQLRPGPDVRNVVVLTSTVNHQSYSEAAIVKLRGSKSKLDEIVRAGRNTAVVTLNPRRADFDSAPAGGPLKVKVQLTAENLNLPADVKIVSAPAVTFEIDEEIKKEFPVEYVYSPAAKAKIESYGKAWRAPIEQKVFVKGPSYLLTGDWRPKTEPIGEDELPQPGETKIVTLRLLDNIRSYFTSSPYRYQFTFDNLPLLVRLEVAEETVTETFNLPIGILAPDPQWIKDYYVDFVGGASSVAVEISVPKSKKGQLTAQNLSLFADFREVRTVGLQDVKLLFNPPLPDWAAIITPLKTIGVEVKTTKAPPPPPPAP
jgi:hypothetical protein